MTTDVSTISRKVGSITVRAMIHLLMFFMTRPFREESFLFCDDRRDNGEAHPQEVAGVLSRIQRDLYRHPLDHLDEIARRVLRGEKGERRPCAGHDAVDLSIEGFVGVGVDLDHYLLARPHPLELGLLVVGGDPCPFEGNDCQERLTGLNLVTYLHGLLAHESVYGRVNLRVAHI